MAKPKPRSPAQRAATARNYTIFRLRGLSACVYALIHSPETKGLFTKTEVDDLLNVSSLAKTVEKRLAAR